MILILAVISVMNLLFSVEDLIFRGFPISYNVIAILRIYAARIVRQKDAQIFNSRNDLRGVRI